MVRPARGPQVTCVGWGAGERGCVSGSVRAARGRLRPTSSVLAGQIRGVVPGDSKCVRQAVRGPGRAPWLLASLGQPSYGIFFFFSLVTAALVVNPSLR